MAFNLTKLATIYNIYFIIFFSKYCDVFVSVAERCENIMLTLVKRSTERNYASFTARFVTFL